MQKTPTRLPATMATPVAVTVARPATVSTWRASRADKHWTIEEEPVVTKPADKQLEKEVAGQAEDLLTAVRRFGIATKDCKFNKAGDLYSEPCLSAMKALSMGGPSLHADDDEGREVTEEERARRKEDEELCVYNTAVLKKMKVKSDRKKSNTSGCFEFYKENAKVIGNQRP